MFDSRKSVKGVAHVSPEGSGLALCEKVFSFLTLRLRSQPTVFSDSVR
jgi:hypothetical protein